MPFTSWKFNATTLDMNLLTSTCRKKWKAKARSDEIDLRLKKKRNFQDNITMSCWWVRVFTLWSTSATRTICINLLGIRESEATAFSLVKRMKMVHDATTHAHGGLIEFRPVIRKILLQNSHSIVIIIQSQNHDLGPISRSNKVSCPFYILHLLL